MLCWLGILSLILRDLCNLDIICLILLHNLSDSKLFSRLLFEVKKNARALGESFYWLDGSTCIGGGRCSFAITRCRAPAFLGLWHIFQFKASFPPLPSSVKFSPHWGSVEFRWKSLQKFLFEKEDFIWKETFQQQQGRFNTAVAEERFGENFQNSLKFCIWLITSLIPPK